MDSIAETGIAMWELCAVGGGSKSDAWLQITADILGKPVVRAKVAEAGCLGAAILAGAGIGTFASLGEGVSAMVSLGERFEPEPGSQRLYKERHTRYRELWPLMKDYLKDANALSAAPG